MSDANSDAMTVTIDKVGRLVVPKPIRDEAGILPGMPLRIRVREGRIEIEPPTARYRLVRRKGFLVAESLEPLTPLTKEEVRETIRSLRERRSR